MNLKRMESYLRVNLLGPGPRLMEKEKLRDTETDDRKYGFLFLSKRRDFSFLRIPETFSKWPFRKYKSRLNSGNARCHSVENLLSSSLLSKNINIKIHRTMILPVALYGCETWSLALREERRLRVYENRVLRGIFGAMRDEVTGEWRKLHNEELNDLYC